MWGNGIEWALSTAATMTPDIAVRWKRQTYNPLVGLTAQRLAQILIEFDLGYLRQAALTWEQMIQRDDKMIIAVPKMIRRVAQRPWDVLIGEDVPEALKGEAERHRDALKYFYANLRCENVIEPNESGGVKLLIRRMMSARLYKYALAEIVWRPSAAGLTATTRFAPLALFNTQMGDLKYSDVAYIVPGQDLDKSNWLVAVSDVAIMKALSICYMFKRPALGDALSFCQRFGIPTVHGETDMKPGSDEWNAFVAALKSMANDQTIATTLGSKINILETSAADGEAVFGWLIELMNRAIVTICCGSDLSTMSSKDGTGASLQGSDADDLTADHCDFVTELFNEQLDRRVIVEVFGDGIEPLAFFKLMPPQDEDVEKEMKIDDHVTTYGVVLSKEDIAERYGRVHSEQEAEEEPAEAATDPTLAPETDSVSAVSAVSAAAANEAALDQLERHQLQQFTDGVHEDDEPLIDILRPLVFAHGADATRSALHTLAAHMVGLEDKIIDQDASAQALEVAVAADFLRGLAANGDEAADDAIAGNANPFHDALGRFTRGAGKSREGRTAPRKDAFGPLPAPGGFLSPEQNLERGKRAMDWVIKNKGDVHNAMHVPGLGRVAFRWGDSGKKKKEHEEGYGLYHIIDKHGLSAAKALPHTLVNGRIYPHPKEPRKKKLVFDGTNLASLGKMPHSNSIALTSFERPSRAYLKTQGIHV